MINGRIDRLKRFCCDDISLIENYQEAVNDKTPLTTECLKGPGCPEGVDLRECIKWPNNCPLVHVHGSDIILESPQQKLFPDIQDDPE